MFGLKYTGIIEANFLTLIEEKEHMHWMLRVLFSGLSLSVFIHSSVAASSTHRSIVEACSRTVNDTVWYLDHPGANLSQTAMDYAGLFTDNAELTQPDDNLDDRTYVGREQIAERYLDNRADTRFLHVVTNIRVMPTSDRTATGTSYVSFYQHAAGGSMKDKGAITGVMESRDEYRITEKGCKITKRISILRMISLVGIIATPLPN